MVELLFIYLEKILHSDGLSDSTAQDCLLSFSRLLDQPAIIQRLYDSNVLQWIQSFYNKVPGEQVKVRVQVQQILIKLFDYDL